MKNDRTTFLQRAQARLRRKALLAVEETLGMQTVLRNGGKRVAHPCAGLLGRSLELLLWRSCLILRIENI